MADVHVKVGSAWKALAKPGGAYIKKSGAWKQVNNIYIKKSGAWKLAWGNQTINLSGTDVSPNTNVSLNDTPATVYSGWKFYTDGDMARRNPTGANWMAWNPTPNEWADPESAGTGNNYWIRFTHNGGTAPNTGDSTGTWHALSSDREFGYTRSALGTTTGEVKVEIASDSSGTTIVATGYYDYSATVESGA